MLQRCRDALPDAWMDEAKRAAFRATHYCFALPDGELLLTVDEPSPRLAALLRDRNAPGMAVLTAFNPRGMQQSPALNDQANARLRGSLEAHGYRVVAGLNVDPLGQWPDEASFLVPGISRSQARELALRHDQLAFLWTDAASATPRLIETAAPD